MKTFLALSLLALPVLLLTGCAGTDDADAPSSFQTGAATANNEQPVSDIPWNRPEPWEGQGQLGGLGQSLGTR